MRVAVSAVVIGFLAALGLALLAAEAAVAVYTLAGGAL